jgi:protoheme IX farnesyltransferase
MSHGARRTSGNGRLADVAATPTFATTLEAIETQRVPCLRASAAADYWALTKPDVNFLIVLATGAGFYLGRPIGVEAFPLMRLMHTLVGTLLVASGAATLNQYVERRFDAQMRRTARRPLAAGRCAGALYLAAALNAWASILAILTVASYLGVYTPLKRKTPVCTLVGACSGATPPLIGWVAASGRLTVEAWILYGILFLWQVPHVMAIAWMYREDYDRAGYRVLPAGASRDGFMAWQSVLPAVALIPLTLMPTFLGDADRAYLIGPLLLGAGFVWYAAHLALRRSNASARRLLLASIVYLPALLILLMAESG